MRIPAVSSPEVSIIRVVTGLRARRIRWTYMSLTEDGGGDICDPDKYGRMLPRLDPKGPCARREARSVTYHGADMIPSRV